MFALCGFAQDLEVLVDMHQTAGAWLLQGNHSVPDGRAFFARYPLVLRLKTSKFLTSFRLLNPFRLKNTRGFTRSV